MQTHPCISYKFASRFGNAIIATTNISTTLTIEFIHKKLVEMRNAGKAVLLVSLELEEGMSVPDRILVMYEGEIVGELDPKTTTTEELGLYMAGAKRGDVNNG